MTARTPRTTRASGARAGDEPALMNGEPTEGCLALGTKGAVRMTVRTEGRAAHWPIRISARRRRWALVRLLAELERSICRATRCLGTRR